MNQGIEDIRIQWTKVVLPPVFLEEERPMSEQASPPSSLPAPRSSTSSRSETPVCWCSSVRARSTTPKRRVEYAALLKSAIAEFSADLRIVMRVYFEKPRTTIGWKGLINDPYLDLSYKINDGLRLPRHLLLDLAEMGVPSGTEFLDMISPQYIAGLVRWGAIGARTTESQVHRQLVSGVSCPVGFKNGTSGDVQVAIDAILSAAHSHTFLGHTKHGQSAIFVTTGNPDTHIILRGGRETGELHRRCRRRDRCEDGEGRARAAHHDRLQPRQQQQGLPTPGHRVPRCCRADRRRQPQHHRRDAREQPGRRRAEARSGQAAGLWPEHHRRLYRLAPDIHAAPGIGRGRACPPFEILGEIVACFLRKFLADHLFGGSAILCFVPNIAGSPLHKKPAVSKLQKLACGGASLRVVDVCQWHPPQCLTRG